MSLTKALMIHKQSHTRVSAEEFPYSVTYYIFRK